MSIIEMVNELGEDTTVTFDDVAGETGTTGLYLKEVLDKDSVKEELDKDPIPEFMKNILGKVWIELVDMDRPLATFYKDGSVLVDVNIGIRVALTPEEVEYFEMRAHDAEPEA